MKFALAAIAVMAPCLALTAQAESTPTEPRRCTENRTVFQDVSRIGRRDRLAANVTDRHEEMNALGWYFVDLDIYTENGDLEGVFLTYARDMPCTELSNRD